MMFSLVVLENKNLAILEALMTRFGPASMSTPKSTTPCGSLNEATTAAESAFDKLKWDDWRLDKWIFHHGTRVPRCPYGSHLTLEAHQLRCEHLAQNMRWSLVPWYRGFEQVNLLITSDCTLAEDIADLASSRSPFPSVHYQHVETLKDSLRTAIFDDYALEGQLIWHSADLTTEPPILLCFFSNETGDWYMPYTSELAQVDRREWTEYETQVEMAAFRATCRSAYEELWKRCDRVESVILWVVSGSSDVETILDKRLRWNDELKPHVDWYYGQRFGGGENEYFFEFWARDASLTQQVWEKVGELSQQHESIQQIARV